jgi:predicted ATPase
VRRWLVSPAFFTDNNLSYVLVYHMVSTTLQHGTAEESAHAYVWLGSVLGPILHRYRDGQRFGQLACDLVEKYGFTGAKATTYMGMEMVVLWTEPIAMAIEFVRQAFRAGVTAGDLSFACFSCDHFVTDLLLQGAHLDDVWCETETALDFVHNVQLRDAAETLASQ